LFADRLLSVGWKHHEDADNEEKRNAKLRPYSGSPSAGDAVNVPTREANRLSYSFLLPRTRSKASVSLRLAFLRDPRCPSFGMRGHVRALERGDRLPLKKATMCDRQFKGNLARIAWPTGCPPATAVARRWCGPRPFDCSPLPRPQAGANEVVVEAIIAG